LKREDKAFRTGEGIEIKLSTKREVELFPTPLDQSSEFRH
jgi:hypothetical protein